MRISILWLAHFLWALTLTRAFGGPDPSGISAPALTKRDTVSDILTDIEDAASCVACEVMVIVLRSGVRAYWEVVSTAGPTGSSTYWK